VGVRAWQTSSCPQDDLTPTGHAEGTVERVEPNRVEIESKGKTITRKGTEENPAAVVS
jgi:hypothetical protein